MLEFRSKRGKGWADRADPELVAIVNRQVASFWARRDLERIEEEHSFSLSSDEAATAVTEGAMPITDISKILGMERSTLSRWIRENELPSAGYFIVKRGGKTSRREVFTWPGLVVAEIVRRNATRTRSKKIVWIGEEALVEAGYASWLETDTLCLE